MRSSHLHNTMDSFSSRIGCFFIFIGVFLLIIFLASDAADTPSLLYLVGSTLLLLLGFGFWRRGYSPPAPSNRFRVLKRPKKDESQKS